MFPERRKRNNSTPDFLSDFFSESVRKRNNSTADFLSESFSAFLAEIMKQRTWRYANPNEEEEFKRRAVHISIVLGYSSFFSWRCDMSKLPCTASFIRNLNSAISASPTGTFFSEVVASFAQELQEFLVVPRTSKYYDINNRIKKYQLLEAFISFLLQLLSHKTDPIINLYGDRIGNLEKELRFLHSILEEESLMVCAGDKRMKFRELLAEFEDVANEAGRLVHSLFFTIHIQASREMDEGLAVVLNHIDLLKANIMKFLNLLPSISRSPYITPKTSVLDSLRILDTLIYDLEDLIQEDNPIADVKDQIKILHQRLISLQSSIKQVWSQQPSQIVELREPLMRMGDMAHQAEYLIISYKAGDVPHWYVINKLTNINDKIELIGKELHEIAKKYEFGGLEVVRAQPLLQAKRNNEVDDVTVGFEDMEKDILDKLVGEGTEQLQVIAIFGMPGIGKTTLARKSYNHPIVKNWFDRQSWCVVSQTYHRQSILAAILTNLESELEKDEILKMEEERLVETIYKLLMGRRYLVVMDDVWDSNMWDDLRRCFPDDGNGSKIMFTSRNKNVAPPNSIIYAQTNLSNDRCWELLEKRVFGNKPCPSELLEIGKRIAANCGGLPLAVVVIAGVLSTMDKEKTTWKELAENRPYYTCDGVRNLLVMRILKLSYWHLPDHLKPCFLSFGRFEEDNEISARTLMRLWIAEGFVHKEKEKSAENVAEEYLMELIDKSLVMVAKRSSDGGVKACVIHDLLLELCSEISKDENVVKFVNMKQPSEFRNISVDIRGIVDLPLAILTMRKKRYIEVCNGAHVIYEATYDKYCNSYQTINLEFLSGITIRSLKDEEMLKCSPRLRKLKCRWNTFSDTEERTRRNLDLSFLTQLELLNVSFDGVGELEEIRFPSNIRKLTLEGFRLSWEKMSIIGRLEKLELLKLRYCRLGKRWDTRDGEFQKLKFLKLTVDLTEWNVKSSQHFPVLQRLVLERCPNLEEIPSEIGEITTLLMIEAKGYCRNSMVESARRIQQEQSELGNEEPRIKKKQYLQDILFLTIPKPMLPERRERNNSTADFLSESVLAFLAEIMKQRKWRYRYRDEDEEFKRRALHISIVLGNSSFFSRTCDMGKLPCTASFIRNLNFAESANPTRTALREVMASFAQELQEFLVVPRPDKFHESNNRIKKYQLLEAFISFLLQLLSHKTDPIINLYGDRIGNLEKELRFLHSILEDESLMVCADDEHIKFQELLAEFEDVANEAGRLVHSLFFTIHIQASREMDEGLAVVLNHIDLLKPNIMKFSNLLPSISRSAYITPKTSVLDSLRILDTLIYDLEDLIQEDNPIADVKDQIKILHQRLISLQSSIKQVRSQQPSQIVELREPLMRMGDMAHEAEYLIISYKAGDVPHWYVINKLTYVNHQIEFIGKDLHEIAKKYEFGGLEVVRAQPLLQAKRNNEVDGVTVGFEDKETDILDKLVGEGTEQLQVIAIFGMPGIGKTTLAKKLYNHPTIKDRFDRQSWCAVSQTYHRQGLLAGILTDLESKPKKDQILAMEEERLVETIYKTLKGRRYLVVMDDVWDSKVWDVLWRCFPDDGNGSKIMFTSRNKDVAPPNSIIYAQTNWSNDRCWELLEKRLFGNKPCPSELLEIGKRIAANCGGLPLAVVVIAGVLSTMDKEKTTWKEVEENLASYIFDGGDNSSVMQILELSYKHLPDHLKPCFLFFGRFEEDNEISARTLMRLWIAEGFVHKEKEMSVENVAEEYLMELIDKSLVMVARRRSDGGVKACVIHDLLLDLCKKISKDENFLKFVNIDYHTLYRGHQHNSPFHFWDTSPFYFWGTSPFYVRDLRILRVFFSFSRDHCCRRGIEYLVNLRYLIIEDLTAHSLPPFIGSLVNLEYLSVDTLQEVNLPLAILTMRKLRYLEVLFSANVIYEATHDKYRNSYQTINLEFLSLIEIRSLKDEEMLKCSPRLRKLKCRWITFSDTEERTRRNLDLSFLTQLELLNVSFDGVGELEEIRFPSNIRKLTLYGFTLSWEQMSIIGRLEKLELLKLEQCDWGKRWDTRDGEFQKLKVFKLIINGHLTEWNVESSQHFPMLQRLVLEGCTKLKEIPSEIGEIPTLQMIEVKGYCRKPMVESARRIQQEQSELGNEELRIIINPTYILE